MEPRTTPGLIAHKVEIRILGHWYLWGLSANPIPEALSKYANPPKKEDIRTSPVWASRKFELEFEASRVY
jgi:hypothetical protein